MTITINVTITITPGHEGVVAEALPRQLYEGCHWTQVRARC